MVGYDDSQAQGFSQTTANLRHWNEEMHAVIWSLAILRIEVFSAVHAVVIEATLSSVCSVDVDCVIQYK